MLRLTFIAMSALLLLGSSFAGFAQGPAVPAFIKPAHAEVLRKWMRRHPEYRVATESDCRCDEDLARIRTKSEGAWKAVPNYQPYYVEGDFNWDRAKDFAVGIVKGERPSQFRLAVFHGPFGPEHSGRAAFLSDPMPLGQAFFFGDPRPHPQMLVVGPFESEGGALRPTKTGYVWDYGEDK